MQRTLNSPSYKFSIIYLMRIWDMGPEPTLIGYPIECKGKLCRADTLSATSLGPIPMAENAHEKRHTLDDLLVVMARLRDPEGGCPWDVKQNFSTIAPYTIEEAYEVADAIARDDLEALKDELGDLLLQVVYHAQMAREQSRFDFSDVADAVARKMIRRHPHVFADRSLRDEFLTGNVWERIKAEEKAERGETTVGAASRLDDVPLALPALTRAVKLQKRAAAGRVRLAVSRAGAR